ncbi:hypothetical protein LTR53_017880, partial [Teratosphaeriaceae sp. CCFEE 6253]
MLAIQPAPRRRALTPNILPCTIHHNGPLKIAKRYWDPQTTSGKTDKTAYLRGRKLRGRVVKLPEGYQGYVLQKTERDTRPDAQTRQGAMRRMVGVERDEMGDEDDDDDDEADEVKVMEEKAIFSELVVWGHEVLPDDGDECVKGIEEWMAFAEA